MSNYKMNIIYFSKVGIKKLGVYDESYFKNIYGLKLDRSLEI